VGRVVKLMAMYKPPGDKNAFDRHYGDVHTPLVRKLPGLRRLEVARCFGSPGGEPRYYLVGELYFDNQEAMFAALNSPEGKAAAKDVRSFAGDLVHMMFADVEE